MVHSFPTRRSSDLRRAEQHPRPGGIVGVPVVEPLPRPEVADAFAPGVRCRHEFRCNRVESAAVADRCSSHYHDAAVPHKPYNAVAGAREPQLDPRIQYLVRSRVPPESKYEGPRPLMLGADSRNGHDEMIW